VSAAASDAAEETQQLSYVPTTDTIPVCYLCGVARGSRQPMTGRLATHPSNTTVVQATSFDGIFLLVAFHYIALVCNYCFFIVVNKISI